MADFNPQIPNANDPNYFRYSDSISNIKADTSKGQALETFGNAITGATKLADQTVKESIDKTVREGAEKERGSFTSALEAIKGGLVPAAVQTPAGSSALSFADDSGSQAPAPAAIDAALGKVNAVQDAMKSGKVNDTYYSQQLNSVVQRTRAQYPGYVDYIDSKVAEITGMNPANQYVKNLMEDINRAQTNKKTEYDKDLDLARGALKTGIPGADAMFNALQANPDFAPQFRSWFANENAKLYKIQAQDAERNNMKGTKEEIASKRVADFTNEVGATVDSNFHSIVKIAGVETPQAILDTVSDMQANPGKYTEQQMEAFATKILAQKNILATQLKQRANQLTNGVSYASDIGSDKVDGVIKSQLSVYDNVFDALKNKDAGAAFYHMNQARAMLDQTKDNLLSNKDFGKDAATFKFFQDTMGPAWTGLVIDQNLRNNIDQKIRGIFNSNAVEARAQPDLAKNGQPVTITQQMDGISNDKRITKPQRAQLYSSMVDIVDDIRNPKAPDADKANVIRHLFDPSATSILKNFRMDYYDPDQHRNVEGKYGVWTRLTKPDVTDNIAKIAKSDPQSGQMYVNWVKTTGRELIGQDVQTLNHFTGHDNLSFEWDSKAKQITLVDAEAKPGSQRLSVMGPPGVSGTIAPPMDKGYKFQVQQVVSRVNSGLKNLSHVMDSFGGDTESMLLQTLQDYGLNNEGKVTGLPKALGDAVAASRKPQQRLDDAFGDTKK